MTQSEGENAHKLIGQTVGGKYQVIKLLGEGGMGCVYEAHQKLGDTVRKVAIKTLHDHLSHDPKILARFEREVGTVASLTHPNTIQVYDFGKTDSGTLYIAMEFVQGKSVAESLEKEGPMQPERVVKILEQVCGSLEEAHNAGIIHRDLKPDNVVLCDKAGQKDWVEVLDFGIAKRGSEADPQEQKLTQQGMVLGTPPYMSPEQFTGQPIDRRSDIYALGVMAYEMLSGRLPFAGNTAWEWATAHMTAQPVSLDATPMGSHIPPHMKAAIMKALEKNRDARWGTVKEFMDAFSGRTGAPVSTGTAQLQQQQPAPRTKTEVGGAPVQMDFGGPPAGAMTPPGQPQMGGVPYVAGAPVPPHPGTPAAGNLSYPAPQPQQQRSGGGGKGAIIAVLVLLLLVFGGVGIFAVVKSQSGKKPVVTPIPTSTDTQAANTGTTTASDTTTAPTDTGLPTLHTGTAPPPPPPTVKKDGGTGPTPTATTTTTATATATATATHTATQTATQPPPPPPPTGNPNLPECVVARAFCSKGRPECEAKKAACLSKGGAM